MYSDGSNGYGLLVDLGLDDGTRISVVKLGVRF